MSISTPLPARHQLLSSDRPTNIEAADYLEKLFGAFRPCIVTDALFDFSRLHSGYPRFCEVSPISIVQLAGEHGIPLRTRGRGHALNGSSLPQKSELTVNTRNLTKASLQPDGTVAVGGGAVLWMVDEWLRTAGLSLPVVNDGYAGPSVGGFVAAGGFGPGSATAGGFWNNVSELTIVGGQGQIQRLGRDAPLFPWLFGAMGQLGIIVEAKLDTVARATALPVAGSEQLEALEGIVPDGQKTSSAPITPDAVCSRGESR